MALSPTIDALVAQVNNLQALVDSLNGTNAIEVSVGGQTLNVDPTTMRDAFNRGADILRTVAQEKIIELKDAIATAAIEAATPPTNGV